MMKLSVLLLATLLISSGCATTSPVAVSCPAPAPTPKILTESPSTGPSLTERFETLLEKLRKSLASAERP